jgi:hypothetical protein
MIINNNRIIIHKYFLIIYYILKILFCQIVFIYITILGQMAHNVPAVYDVFAARIRALHSKDQGCKNVAEFWRGNGAKRNDLAKTEPEPPTGGEAYTVLLCEVPLLSIIRPLETIYYNFCCLYCG